MFSAVAQEEQEQHKKAECYIAEAARLEQKNRTDVEMHREKAEFYIAEAARLEQENQIQRDKVMGYVSEVAQLKADLQACRENVERYFRASDLPNLPLHHLLAALPVNIRRTLTGTKKRPA